MDAYNANPTSMSASIKSFMENLQDEKYLILGDMLELGDDSAQEHKNIISSLPQSIRKNVYLVGNEFMKATQDDTIKTFKSVADLCLHLKQYPIKNGNILIKGSRGIQLEKVLDLF